MKLQLKNYQKRIVEFCKSTDKVILSISMGLGKTAAVLHYIDYAKPKTLLIVAPKFVALNVWKQEAEKWGLTELAEKLTIVHGPKAKRMKLIGDSSHLIVTRDNLNDVRGMEVDLLVMDELTSFKNHASQRSDAVYSIKARQRIALTGTLITNSAVDLFGQFLAVGYGNDRPKRERNQMFYRWRGRHFVDLLAGSGLQFHKWKLITPMDELIAKVRPSIFTLDSKDWLEIPEVEYITHTVTLSDAEMTEYMRLNTMLSVQLGDEVVAFSENQKFAKLQTLCNGFVYVDDVRSGLREVKRSDHSTKLDQVVEFVARAVSEGEQVLLFYAFIEEKEWLQEKLKKQGVTISGTHDKDFLSKWNEREVDVLLLNPASAGHGLSLHNSGCRLMVWSSLPFDLELYSQANARLTRQGQKRGVQIHSFMAKGTVEPKKYKSLNKKQELLQEFIDLTK
jgi:SNF2 family DNA or RNA helicase